VGGEWPERGLCSRCGVELEGAGGARAFIRFTYMRRLANYCLCSACTPHAEAEVLELWRSRRG
jgi:hypothetical protein